MLLNGLSPDTYYKLKLAAQYSDKFRRVVSKGVSSELGGMYFNLEEEVKGLAFRLTGDLLFYNLKDEMERGLGTFLLEMQPFGPEKIEEVGGKLTEYFMEMLAEYKNERAEEGRTVNEVV